MVFVLTPQDLAALIVKKAMNMARDLHVPLLGVVENMAWISCPHCRERIELFGPSRVARVAQEYGIPVLGSLPVLPPVSELSDAGRLGELTVPEVSALGHAFTNAVDEATKNRVTVL
jgi:ATP-binding protein involved in chromosome partitioning